MEKINSHGYINLRFEKKPSQEILAYLKENGWTFTRQNGGAWYPWTKEARESNAAFVKGFEERFSAELEGQTMEREETGRQDIYTNEILDKIRSAGIEVITDKMSLNGQWSILMKLVLLLKCWEKIRLLFSRAKKKRLETSAHQKMTS